ncbi:MAG TPA: glycosyltransferase family 39 protein [Desulfobacteria bacterium]|nr:glycosyltransferase family 39 protein [Desulfobacteria bacterium]
MKPKTQTVLILAFIILAAAIVWYSYYSLTFVALAYNDSMDYASIARNVADGEGFVSSYITPLGLAHKGVPHPDLWRAPLWPAAIALFIKIFGAIDQAVAFASGFFYLAAVPLIFLLARQLFGNPTALSTALIYMFSAQNLHFSTSGLTEPMALLMLTAIIFIMYIPFFKSPPGDFLLGLAAGLFYLARYNALLFIPVIALVWCALRRPAGLIAGVRLGAAFSLTVMPWMWRNYVLMGNPLFSLQKYEPVMFTQTYPGYTLYTMFEKVNVTGFIMSHSAEMWIKVGQNWQDFTHNLFAPTFTGVYAVLFVLFLLSLFLPFDEKQRYLRPLLLVCFGLQLAALMVIHYIPRLFFMFTPFYIMYGMAAVNYLAGLISKKRSITLISMGLLTALFIITNLPVWNEPNVDKPLIRDYSASVKKITLLAKKSDLILSNDGHILAWYGNRYAAKLPYRTDMLPELERLVPVKMIFLSGRMSWNMPEADESWRKVFWGKPQQLYGFRLLERFEDGSLLYVR